MSDSHQSLTDSEEEEEFVTEKFDNPSIKGVLSKWTNYIHGWQDRFVCCQDGTLSYYRAQDETAFGCRGSISLTKASTVCHEFDPCRFDIAINDSVWYFRAATENERQEWIEVIEVNKVEGDNVSLRRHGSLMSLGSAPSITSSSSFRKGRGLKEKLNELETFRDILDRQVDTLQDYFDACAQQNQAKDDLESNGEVGEEGDVATNLQNHLSLKSSMSRGIDFKGEAITFKATTNGILNTLSHCVELINKREEVWQRRLDKERERRKKSEEQYNSSLAAMKKNAFVGSPDYVEGPQSGLTEEEFYDAVEAELDKQERFTQDIEHSRSMIREAEKQPKRRHKHSDELEKKIQNHLTDSMKPPGADGDIWELFAEEGEMKIYRKELVEDGLICDPLKAVHSIGNVTAREMCHYFWDTDVRMEWEGTIESFRVIEVPEEFTTIIYQTHRRVWPSAQRDCLYLSSMVKVDNPPSVGDKIPHDTWIVCNFSVDHPEANPVSGCVRALIEIALICQTFITPPKDGGPITRDCLQCDIIYVANVNPGGWAPASVLRSIYKREYPKFLRRFTAYVQDKTRKLDILF
uniref:collagen type IV alpha-3-binding protein n=1 Tax=Ciona intestinalis TaxID=7719 RepID=UPI000180B3A3|nr:collagen type IV alpha-3-binding protein [Ciona intestinalis]|eukprot:XP_002129577.1 collagen type IV alpha-3-binding protein [Ciona intestinalis]